MCFPYAQVKENVFLENTVFRVAFSRKITFSRGKLHFPPTPQSAGSVKLHSSIDRGTVLRVFVVIA